MNKYLLDTNIVAYIEAPSSIHHLTVRKHLSQLSDQDEVYLSILTLYELEYGISNAPQHQKKRLTLMKNSLKESFTLLPLTEGGAEIFGDLKTSYREITGISQKAISSHNVDFMLAGSAIVEEAILVSNDTIFQTIQKNNKDFRFENWTV